MSWTPQQKPVINPKWVPRGSEVMLLEAASILRVFGQLGCALGVLGVLLTFFAPTSWSLLDGLFLAILAPLAGSVGHAVLGGFSDIIKLLKQSAGMVFSGTISGANVPYIADSSEGGPYFLRGEGPKGMGRASSPDQAIPPKS